MRSIYSITEICVINCDTVSTSLIMCDLVWELRRLAMCLLCFHLSCSYGMLWCPYQESQVHFSTMSTLYLTASHSQATKQSAALQLVKSQSKACFKSLKLKENIRRKEKRIQELNVHMQPNLSKISDFCVASRISDHWALNCSNDVAFLSELHHQPGKSISDYSILQPHPYDWIDWGSTEPLDTAGQSNFRWEPHVF